MAALLLSADGEAYICFRSFDFLRLRFPIPFAATVLLAFGCIVFDHVLIALKLQVLLEPAAHHPFDWLYAAGIAVGVLDLYSMQRLVIKLEIGRSPVLVLLCSGKEIDGLQFGTAYEMNHLGLVFGDILNMFSGVAEHETVHLIPVVMDFGM